MGTLSYHSIQLTYCWQRIFCSWICLQHKLSNDKKLYHCLIDKHWYNYDFLDEQRRVKEKVSNMICSSTCILPIESYSPICSSMDVFLIVAERGVFSIWISLKEEIDPTLHFFGQNLNRSNLQVLKTLSLYLQGVQSYD